MKIVIRNQDVKHIITYWANVKIKNLFLNNNIYYMKYDFFLSPIHGIGCKALVDIKKGDVVANEPYFICNIREKVFKDYYWNIEGKLVLINGLGKYCNHSLNNNIKPILNFKRKPFVQFVALCDIKKGEELFCNYGINYWKTRGKNIDVTDNQKYIMQNKQKNIPIGMNFRMF